MKKLITLALATLMISTLSMTAFAAEVNQDTDDQTGSTAVSFNVDPTYTVTIPATVELEKVEVEGVITYEKNMNVSASSVRLEEGQKIEIKLSGDFTLDAVATSSYKLPYTVTVGGRTIATNGVVATFVTTTQEQTSTLHFAAENPTYAGTYTDTVTFTIGVVNE